MMRLKIKDDNKKDTLELWLEYGNDGGVLLKSRYDCEQTLVKIYSDGTGFTLGNYHIEWKEESDES